MPRHLRSPRPRGGASNGNFFQDWPWPLQALFYLGLTVVIIAAGFYIPGLPLASVRAQLQDAQKQEKPLEQEVANLRVYKQRRAELQSQMDALQKQLATLQTIVPEEKQVDQFILMIQAAATSSGVSMRRLTAKPVATKPYYFELPFEVQADGPYFSVLDFFADWDGFANYQRGRPEAGGDRRHSASSELPIESGSFGDRNLHDYDILYESGRRAGGNNADGRTGKTVGDDDDTSEDNCELIATLAMSFCLLPAAWGQSPTKNPEQSPAPAHKSGHKKKAAAPARRRSATGSGKA